jgi:hypothetical protein
MASIATALTSFMKPALEMALIGHPQAQGQHLRERCA